MGAFVLSATILLIMGLYYIGSKKNIFRKTIKLTSKFANVGGLMPGNNVRYNGINVGTISKIYVISDTLIKVDFTLEEKVSKFISKDAIATIGTDGLLGNKLINITPGKAVFARVQSGDSLRSISPLQMDVALRNLSITNDNLMEISSNLKVVSSGVNNEKSVWNLLSDTLLAHNIHNVVVSLQITGNNTASISGDLRSILHNVKAGKGSIGALITDTSFSHQLHQTIVGFKSVSDSFALITGDFKEISSNLKSGKGAIGTLLTDTNFVYNLNSSMNNIQQGTKGFDDNMEALKHSILFRKYFKKKQSKIKSNPSVAQ